MIIVYSAANALEGHMIKGLLEQYDIPAYVQGEHLQSGVGQLPAIAGFIKVSVDGANQAKAEKIIKEWEANNNFKDKDGSTTPLPEKASASNINYLGFAASFIVGATCMHFYLQSPVTANGVDLNNDGKNDLTWTYTNYITTKFEADFNFDGEIDQITTYKKGLTHSSKIDADFDGLFDTEQHYKNESIYLQRIDTDNDGKFDLFIDSEINPLNYKATIFNEKTKLIKKTQHYEMNKLISAELDSDDNGKMDVIITYDFFEEELSRKPLTEQLNDLTKP